MAISQTSSVAKDSTIDYPVHTPREILEVIDLAEVEVRVHFIDNEAVEENIYPGSPTQGPPVLESPNILRYWTSIVISRHS